MSKLQHYINQARGYFIDMDAVYGAQCWDLWSHYAVNVIGVPVAQTYTNFGGYGTHQGYACNVYHHAAAAGLTKWFDILPANVPARPGDVAFWDYGTPAYPWSHVAIVERDTGGQLVCLTQNPGRTQTAALTKRGLIGYLRPKQFNPAYTAPAPAKAPTQTTIEEVESVKTAGFYYQRKDGKIINIIVNPVSGFFHDYEANDGGYNSPVAAAFGTGNFAKISESHANKLALDAAKVREAAAAKAN